MNKFWKRVLGAAACTLGVLALESGIAHADEAKDPLHLFGNRQGR